MDVKEDPNISKLRAATSSLIAVLQSSTVMEDDLAEMDLRLADHVEAFAALSDSIAPIQAQSMAAKALDVRINRAVSPALAVLRTFSLVESLQRRLLRLSSPSLRRRRRGGGGDDRDLSRLLKYVDCVDRLDAAIGSVTEECEPAVQRLQEAVEFLSRTKATDRHRIHRLKETMVTLRALYEEEVSAIRYEGILDEALLHLQDEYEYNLLQLHHKVVLGEENESRATIDADRLGSNLEIEVLRRISSTLAGNDCLDICIDIFVKVRYRRASKALMRLNPDYLKTYAQEQIDAMEWESLEIAMASWIQHFELAVKTVLVAEKRLCSHVLRDILDGVIWPECFAKVADKIMAVFFRFGEGVARSSKDPQKLFRFLDMLDSTERMRPEIEHVFDGDPGADIRGRFRELQKLLVHAASKVFWEFGLQIEGGQDGTAPPPDGSVPKIVRYAVNYLKFLATEPYRTAMGKVLRTEQAWKAGSMARADPDEAALFRDAVSSVIDALRRNVEGKRGRYRENVLPHVLAMNTYWYVYMRTRGSELGAVLGEGEVKERYKTAAEEAAYSYQEEAWGPLVGLLESGAGEEGGAEDVRERMEAFARGFDEVVRRHERGYCVPDVDLREQIREAVVQYVVPPYAAFVQSCSEVIQERTFMPPGSMRKVLGRIFDGEERRGEGVGRKGAAEAANVGKGNGRRRLAKKGAR